MEKYLIMGAGNQAFAMASHIVQNGDMVNIWNIREESIKKICNTKQIHCTGIIDNVFTIHEASTNIDDVICDTILISTPAVAHKTLARVLAKKVSSKNTILLSPGRTFGVIEFTEELKKNGCKSLPKIAELQTILYTCRKINEDTVHLFALKDNVAISSIENNLDEILNALPKCMTTRLKKAESFVETSLGNVGMILHCAPVLLNIGWIESSQDFKYYKEGISESVSKVVEKLDQERLFIAEKLGYPIESVSDWMKRIYYCDGDNLHEVIQSNKYYEDILAPTAIDYRYLNEDIPFGLVPLESVAKDLNIELPLTTLLIDLANIIMEKDYRKEGRMITIHDYLK